MEGESTGCMTKESIIQQAVVELGTDLRKWWNFNDAQQHRHSWHDREDFIDKVLPKILEAKITEAWEAGEMATINKDV